MQVLAMSDTEMYAKATADWPTDDHITNVALNGEADAPIYHLMGKHYRINQVNCYALVWTGRKWIENQRVTNDCVLLNGYRVSQEEMNND